jgi:hypothetical protein
MHVTNISSVLFGVLFPDATLTFSPIRAGTATISSTELGDEVGASVALSENGTVMATGAPGSVASTGGKDHG